MTTWQLGQTLVWDLLVTSDGTTAADLGGGDPTATVTLPDGTTDAATVARVSTGLYRASLTSTQAGRHRVTWTGTGNNSGGLPYDDHADVWAADPRLAIPLAEARSALNVPSGTRVDDDELRLFVASATWTLEDIIGPILAASVTRTVSGWGRAMFTLPAYPTDVTEVVEDGVTLTPGTDYCWDEYGIVWRGSRPYAGIWSSLTPRNVSITYSVGSAVVPANVAHAARELVAFQWKVSQQGQRPAFGGGVSAPTDTTPSGYAVPYRVIELLAPQRGNRVAGFA